MKVLVAGATGAIGQPLVRQLIQNGHSVVAIARQRPAVLPKDVAFEACDVLDPDAVARVVRGHRPGAIVSQLTRLPKDFRPRAMRAAYADNDRVRLMGTRNLLRAAEENGVGRFVAQSSGFWYAPTPGAVKTEGDPLWSGAPEPIGQAVRTLLQMESEVQAAKGPKTVLLRYATFYGPDTWFDAEGTVGRLVRKRQYPILGDGSAVMSFIHIEDAAAATVAAVERPVSGVFNVADDEPATTRDWLAHMARCLQAPSPRRAPVWLARLAMGSALTTYSLNTRAAANGRAKALLKWQPRHASWRQGFQTLADRPSQASPAVAALVR